MRAAAPDSKADLSSDRGVAVAVRIVTRIRWGRPLLTTKPVAEPGHVLWLVVSSGKSVPDHSRQGTLSSVLSQKFARI